jgi:hypothetical protein
MTPERYDVRGQSGLLVEVPTRRPACAGLRCPGPRGPDSNARRCSRHVQGAASAFTGGVFGIDARPLRRNGIRNARTINVSHESYLARRVDRAFRSAEANHHPRRALVAPRDGVMQIVPPWPLLEHLRRFASIPVAGETGRIASSIASGDVDDPEPFHAPKSCRRSDGRLSEPFRMHRAHTVHRRGV